MEELKEFSTEELQRIKRELEEVQEEIEKREKIKDGLKKIDRPNWGYITELCECYLHDVVKGEINLKYKRDSERYIFEIALEAVFGQDVWGYINKMTYVPPGTKTGTKKGE